MQDATVARRRVLSRGPAIVLVVLAYVGVVHYAYVNDIAPIFTYLQYGYRPPDPRGIGRPILRARRWGIDSRDARMSHPPR